VSRLSVSAADHHTARSSAHLTGFHQFVLEPGDELGVGFLLR